MKRAFAVIAAFLLLVMVSMPSLATEVKDDMTFKGGIIGNSSSPNGDTVLDTTACGKTIYIGAAGDDFTLPTPTNGCVIRFVVDAAFATTAMTIVTKSSANIMYGITLEAETDTGDDGPPAAGNDTLTFSASLETVGDWVEFRSNGTNWYVNGAAKLDGAFAFSTAS